MDSLTNAVSHVVHSCTRTGDDIVVAYSGGVDSTVLLHALNAISADLGLTLSACHINHGISKKADLWQQNCAEVCAGWHIPFQAHCVRIPVDTGQGIESAARDKRYKVLSENARQWIALAHHKDDQAETVLLNLCRGTGILGLAGMTVTSGRYIRPLFDVSRSEILRYAQHHRLTWIDDESNLDNSYARNFMRNELIPLAETRFPSVNVSLAKAARHAASAQRLLLDLALIDSNGKPLSSFPIDLAPLLNLSDDRQANLLRAKLVAANLQPPAEKKLIEFIRQLSSFRPDRHPALSTKVWELRVKNRQIHLTITPCQH